MKKNIPKIFLAAATLAVIAGLAWQVSAQTSSLAPGKSPDFDDNGLVGFSDFLLFASSFGKTTGQTGFGDQFVLNGDKNINFSDFLIFASYFGKKINIPIPFKATNIISLKSEKNIGSDEYIHFFSGTGYYAVGTLLGEKFQRGHSSQKSSYIYLTSSGDIDENVISVYSDNGYINVFLPNMKRISIDSPSCKLYIADDGSTYFGDSNHDCSGRQLTIEEALIPQHLARATPCKEKCNVYCDSSGICKNNPKNNPECQTLHGDGNLNKLDIVFVADNFGSLADLRNQVSKHVDTIKSLEPYKSNLDKINIYVVNKLNDLNCVGTELESQEPLKVACNRNKVIETANLCEADEIIVLSRKNQRSHSRIESGLPYGNYGKGQNSFAVVFIGQASSSSIKREGKTIHINFDADSNDYAELMDKSVKSCDALPEQMQIRINKDIKLFKRIELIESPVLQMPAEINKFPTDKLAGYYYCDITITIPSFPKFRVTEIKDVNIEANSPLSTVHELGHSFAGLDDEYNVYGYVSAPQSFKSINCVPCSLVNHYTIFETEKRAASRQCTYTDRCKTAHFGIMIGSYIGDLNYGEDNEKYIKGIIENNF